MTHAIDTHSSARTHARHATLPNCAAHTRWHVAYQPRSTPRTAQGTRGCERAEEGSAEMVGGRLLPERCHALSGNRGRVQARASRREHQRLVLCFVSFVDYIASESLQELAALPLPSPSHARSRHRAFRGATWAQRAQMVALSAAFSSARAVALSAKAAAQRRPTTLPPPKSALWCSSWRSCRASRTASACASEALTSARVRARRSPSASRFPASKRVSRRARSFSNRLSLSRRSAASAPGDARGGPTVAVACDCGDDVRTGACGSRSSATERRNAAFTLPRHFARPVKVVTSRMCLHICGTGAISLSLSGSGSGSAGYLRSTEAPRRCSSLSKRNDLESASLGVTPPSPAKDARHGRLATIGEQHGDGDADIAASTATTRTTTTTAPRTFSKTQPLRARAQLSPLDGGSGGGLKKTREGEER